MSYKFWRNAAIATGVLASVGISGMVFASQNPQTVNNLKNNFHNRACGMMHYGQHENFEALDKAIENGDYQAWKSLITQDDRHPMIADKITEANFSKLQEMHQARVNGDTEKADAIRQELGLPDMMNHRGGRRGHGRKGGNFAMRDEVRQAVENNDYAKWKDLLSKNERHPQILDKVTADNFSKLKEMHDARLAGDTDKVESIRKELGLPERGQHRGQGQGQGRGSQR